jgi:5-hydroxyisourate hydrolase
MSLSTHVLDTATGRPASGLLVELFREDADGVVRLGHGHTNDDGRVKDLVPQAQMISGVYRLRFDTGSWHAAQGVVGFYPDVVIRFEIRAANEHYHVPLLISPDGYSTYRGS